MSIKGRITRIVGAGLAAFSWPLLAAEADKLATTPIGLTGEAVGAAELMQVSIGLLVVLVVLGGLAWMLRRFNLVPSASGGVLRIVAGLSMGPRERLVLVQVGETQVLLGVAPGRIQTLHVLDQPVLDPKLDGTAGSGESFAERLAASLRKGSSS